MPTTKIMSSPTSIRNVFQGYHAQDGIYDEFLEPAGNLRPHLRQFARRVHKSGLPEFVRRWEQAQRLVHENGFAYKGHGGPDHKPRPWELDPIPVLISRQEWDEVSAALQQRAQVLNLTLCDLLGEQRLIKSGVIPPEFVVSHPGFLQSYHGQDVPDLGFLHFYAADIARSPDGRWWVLNDRTEAPSGLGYALENRVVVSRMLPEVFQDCQIERLAPFFISAQETLRSLAPRHHDNPHVVLLSHGPRSPNYFEDAYLARYLGYTLVEGGDLAVRNRRVWLKTLGGLEPVDVIFRRQNSNDSDPLSLDPTSRIGVTGLTQAVRAGNVGISNSLGSGIVESLIFMAYMPQLCWALLGENLKMPGVATWWCGEPNGLAHVLANIDSLIVQPAFRRRGRDGITRETLSRMSGEELIETIKADPKAFAAQEQVDRSSTPVWNGNAQTGRLALRAWLVSHQHQGEQTYKVLQGALARISSTADPLEVSIRRGEGSKDTWVLADGPVEHVTLLGEAGQSIELRRTGAELPSRVADNIFWLGRQLERTDALTRLLRSAAVRMTGETRSTSDLELPVLLRCLADQGQIDVGYAVDEMRDQLPPIESSLPIAVFDSSQDACLRSVLDELVRLGSIVRDRLSEDSWRIICNIDEGFQPSSHRATDLADLSAMTNRLIIQLAAYSGLITESMTRTLAYRFLQLGQRVERSLQIISLVKNAFIPMPEIHGPVFETVLEVADSLMTYRARYLANLNLSAVLDLLLTDETSPRSLAFQFVQLSEQVDQLPRKRTQPGYTDEQRYAMSLRNSVRMLDIQSISEAHSLGDSDELEQLAEEWESLLPKLSEAISHRYLVHAVPAHQLADIKPQ